MKKLFYLAAVALAATSVAACSSSSKSTDSAEDTTPKKETYTGILPAADADGVRYTLKLDYDKDATKGKYDLDETTLAADSTSTTGFKDLGSEKTKGSFSVMAGDGVNAGKSYLKLVADKKNAADTVAVMPMYFLVDSDSTITMVNAELEPSVNPDLNYTLKLDK